MSIEECDKDDPWLWYGSEIRYVKHTNARKTYKNKNGVGWLIFVALDLVLGLLGHDLEIISKPLGGFGKLLYNLAGSCAISILL